MSAEPNETPEPGPTGDPRFNEIVEALKTTTPTITHYVITPNKKENI